MITYFTILASVLLTCLTLSPSPNNLTAVFLLPNASVNIITDNQPNPIFIYDTKSFDCSLSPLFSYNQSNLQYRQNSPYYIGFEGIKVATSFSFSTVHNNFAPSYSPSSCSSDCLVTLQNNCPSSINFRNYFDRVVLNISGYPQLLTFYVKCNSEYLSNTFEWGLVIQIVFITILVAVVALYSRAWSLGGRGINVDIWIIVAIDVVILIGGIIGYFASSALVLILQILTFLLGILGVGICINEVLFLLRLKLLAFVLFKIKTFEFRVLQLSSLTLSSAVLVGWWFSDSNIILNDIICICICVACIKVLKFTSLLNATIGFGLVMALLVIIALLIYFFTGTSYNSLFINKYNYPFELQIPTINPVFYQKCAWLPFNSIVYPGMLVSFLRRFDSSRNTTLYVILATITFFIGGIAWMFITIASPVSFPFGLVSEPCMIGLVCVFSYRRRELGVLWRGKFYDQEFGDRADLKVTMEMVERESKRESTLGPDLLESTKKLNGRRDSQVSDAADLVRSKFIKRLGQ